ncbi:MAG: hypothetical protein JWM99_2285 [Verrucomicrobiales bacterium]|jgi:uncharacterized protein Yka (UPF0111/DUF47 family)|nr:hypothetical protein [Verrucomicrobiales bacterium]
MFSLQKFLGKEDKFFNLLVASADACRDSVHALAKFIKEPDNLKSLDEFILTRRREKKIADEISEALCTTFITTLEREDIEALSVTLYKIPKTIEKIGERILIAPKLLHGVDLGRHLQILEKSSDILSNMIKELSKGVNLEKVKALNDQLQVLEGEADKLILELLRNLYSGQHDPLKVVFLKDLFELLEKVADRGRDAGNVITHIMLKNS